MGTMVKFRITEVRDQGKKAIGSIRVVLREERNEREASFWSSLETGMQFTGKVKSMTSYGAFVDLGVADGMVHNTELSWKHIKSPSEVVSVGDELTVYVKSFDVEKKRISLGYKTDASNPWTIFMSNYAVDDVVNAKIVSVTTFGAFAEIVDGVDGLIHISQLANTRVAKPDDVVNVGDMVDVKIIAIDEEKKKVSLSIRALTETVEEEVVAEEPAEEIAE
jgi:4-hydroxy-3-methylbut-2-enyl diphosphate reductase